MQERSARHDLEMDKSALERQVLFIYSAYAYTTQHNSHIYSKNRFFFFNHLTVPLPTQMKELKSRVADMEGQARPTAGITLLENKIQELEERLHSEERYNWTHTMVKKIE